ncbi:hypothetical protein [Nocardioides ochotonae]|uniref:hypothetical protein n=1 Tax=Nocardioides ochotonae TaxID=2685869 RepID=UPI0014087093|nr:hypothetical protein [Nocardioides ochotonae]
MVSPLSTELDPALPSALEITVVVVSLTSLVLTVVTVVLAIVQIRRRRTTTTVGLLVIVVALLLPIVGAIIGLFVLAPDRRAGPPAGTG